MNQPVQSQTEAVKPMMRRNRRVPQADLFERFLWLMISLVAITLISFSVWLDPDPAGHGTHEQLGLPPCGLVAVYDMPCPSCGFTTTFALAAHFRFIDAIINQPFGFLIFLGTVISIPVGYKVVVKKYSVLVHTHRWPWRTIIILTIVGWLIGWAYKWSMWPSA